MVAENVIKPSFEILMKTMLHQDSVNVLKALPLSNHSIWRRIDEMSSNVESQLVEKFENSKFSIQLDESTVSDNRAILMAYVRFIDDCCKLCEELLFVKFLEADTLDYPFLKLQNLVLMKIKYHLKTWYLAQWTVLHPCLVSRMDLLLMEKICPSILALQLCGSSSPFTC